MRKQHNKCGDKDDASDDKRLYEGKYLRSSLHISEELHSKNKDVDEEKPHKAIVNIKSQCIHKNEWQSFSYRKRGAAVEVQHHDE
jgi:hypothetical protein